MQLNETTVFTEKCFNGEPASCSYACPFHLDIRSFLDKVKRGKWNAAYKEYRNAAVFPTIVAELCPEPCMHHCQRVQTGDEPIAMQAIEQALLKYAKAKKAESYQIPPKAGRIAVVGAGPTGLSCALNLANKKYQVTVFDKNSSWGGHLREHPKFSLFDEDITLQFAAVSVEFRFGTDVKSLDELADFNAIYVATGRGGTDFGLLPTWEKDLLTTAVPGVFMGGALCSMPLMESIAAGRAVSRTIEGYIQTGRAEHTHGDSLYDKAKCERYIAHPDALPSPLVQPASPDEGYSQKEAEAEASRCLSCDCDACMASCELLSHYRKKPHRMAVEAFSDANSVPPIGTRSMVRETYSCNNCGHCKSICPVDVDIGSLLQFARADSYASGSQITALHYYWLREMEFNIGEGAFSSAPPGRDSSSLAFFPGCQLGAYSPEHVLRSYEILSSEHDAGLILSCCGAPAYWAGDMKRFNEHADALRAEWDNMGRPELVFACSTCRQMFEKMLPEIKGVSLYSLLKSSPSISPVSPFPEVSIFDPCAARTDNEARLAVRDIVMSAGAAVSELSETGKCCGYGGNIKVANPSLYDTITEKRAGLSALPYVVYCANCREVFASRGKDCAHVLDVAFSLRPEPVATIEQKRRNTLMIKTKLMKDKWGKDFIPSSNPWDGISLNIPAELQKSLDQRLISESDIKETIWRSNSGGEKFTDNSGVVLCYMVTDVLTYWVEYKMLGDTYEISDAYTHRMKFRVEA